METATKEFDIEKAAISKIQQWQQDWPLFAREAFGVFLDPEQEEILLSVQHNRRTSVASGTARGKDFIAAVAGMCFMYLTPRWDETGAMVENTKIALTAPTDRQVKNIMLPEISRLFHRARRNGVDLPGRLTAYDIRTENEEWFLTGFKADEHRHEAWSGFHAVNTMFVVTEASGVADSVFDAIEGNLQGNSRILLVFNPNRSIGYAAKSQKSPKWNRFRLNSLTAPNVKEKRVIIPGQVDHEWVQDKLDIWCEVIPASEMEEELDDFQFEGKAYRPNDLFRVKVLGKFPKVDEDVLIPGQWIERANDRWKEYRAKHGEKYKGQLRIGDDVAGMGRDSSCRCYRYDNIVARFQQMTKGGANHMETAGQIVSILQQNPQAMSLIDTIGEGAGVYSRLEEVQTKAGIAGRFVSAKGSHAAKDEYGNALNDITGQYTFANMRAYMYFGVRDWLNPKNEQDAMLPPDDMLYEELTETKWKFQSNGSIIIESKEDIKARIGRSPDKADSLALTFYPAAIKVKRNLGKLF